MDLNRKIFSYIDYKYVKNYKKEDYFFSLCKEGYNGLYVSCEGDHNMIRLLIDMIYSSVKHIVPIGKYY